MSAGMGQRSSDLFLVSHQRLIKLGRGYHREQFTFEGGAF